MKKLNKKKDVKFFNSYNVIIISLIILVLVLIFFCSHLMKSSKTYMFNGSGKYVTIYNGVVSLNYDINIFEGSDITYLPLKDQAVTKYKIGYYVKVNDSLKELVVISDEDKEGYSLKSVFEGLSAFNVTELPKNDKYFNSEKIKNLKNLYFVIEATTKSGEVINESYELNVTKLSR